MLGNKRKHPIMNLDSIGLKPSKETISKISCNNELFPSNIKETKDSCENTIKVNLLDNNNNNFVLNIKDITSKLGNSKIYCRDEEKNKILNFIKSEDKNEKMLFISGQPGTGKTSLISEIFNEDLNFDDKYFLKFSINCLSINTTDDFYEAIIKHLNSNKYYDYFDIHFDEEKRKNILNILKEIPCENIFSKLLILLNKVTFTILLDEIDFLYKKTNDYLFFSLLSIPYLIHSNIKMILISNNSDFDNEIFPKLKNRKINVKKIVFKPYSHKDLTKIMTLKLEAIGLLKYFSSDSIRFLSTKMNKSGDIRPIISIIKEMVLNNKYKIKNDITFKIELKDMFEIIKKKNITLNEIISSMTTEQKIVVAAIYYVCKGSGIKLEEKAVFDKYKNIKHYTNTPLLNTEEFRDVLKTFIDIGLIESLSSLGKGKKSKNSVIYKVKYSDDDLELIFADPLIFTLFNSNQDEEDEKIEKENNEIK